MLHDVHYIMCYFLVCTKPGPVVWRQAGLVADAVVAIPVLQKYPYADVAR